MNKKLFGTYVLDGWTYLTFPGKAGEAKFEAAYQAARSEAIRFAQMACDRYGLEPEYEGRSLSECIFDGGFFAFEGAPQDLFNFHFHVKNVAGKHEHMIIHFPTGKANVNGKALPEYNW